MLLKHKYSFCFLGLFLNFVVFHTTIKAEPWITPDQAWLRADIELLVNLGIIKTPVSTWPLTWGPLIRDLESINVGQIPVDYHRSYFRVLREGRKSTGKGANKTELRASFRSEPVILRQFGDKTRDKRELSTRTTGMTSHLAWNLEATLVPDAQDDDDKHFDGSYLAGVTNNWIFAIGQFDQWWGPGWQHSLILSNNARPIPTFSFRRNYAKPFENRLLNWMGPWTFNAFVGLLDDERAVKDAKVIGMSGSIKPLNELEIGFRRTAQWGGEGRPENFDSFIDMLTGLDNCDEGDLDCENREDEPGNQLAAIDITWHLPWLPTSLYMQLVGEDEAGYFPSKKAYLFGFSTNSILFKTPVFWNFEYINTQLDGDGDGYNTLYEHSIYLTGYRYLGRSLGTTIDNDSRSLDLRILFQTQGYGNFDILVSQVELNRDGNITNGFGGHSIAGNAIKFSQIGLDWHYDTQNFGGFTLSLLSRDEVINTNLGDIDKVTFGLDWRYGF